MPASTVTRDATALRAAAASTGAGSAWRSPDPATDPSGRGGGRRGRTGRPCRARDRRRGRRPRRRPGVGTRRRGRAGAVPHPRGAHVGGVRARRRPRTVEVVLSRLRPRRPQPAAGERGRAESARPPSGASPPAAAKPRAATQAPATATTAAEAATGTTQAGGRRGGRASTVSSRCPRCRAPSSTRSPHPVVGHHPRVNQVRTTDGAPRPAPSPRSGAAPAPPHPSARWAVRAPDGPRVLHRQPAVGATLKTRGGRRGRRRAPPGRSSTWTHWTGGVASCIESAPRARSRARGGPLRHRGRERRATW